MHSFLQDFGHYSFQIDFRILQNLRGVFSTMSNIYDAETLRYRYLIGSKYGSAASLLNIFPLCLCGYLNEYEHFVFLLDLLFFDSSKLTKSNAPYFKW